MKTSNPDILGSIRELSFPIARQPIIDSPDIGARKHYIKALLELDVTRARNAIKDSRSQTGKGCSMLAWFLACVGQACARHPGVHSLRHGKKKLVIFDDVDISIAVEREIEGERVPLPFIVRKTNIKSPSQIHTEIRKAQTGPLDLAEISKLRSRLIRSALLPGFIRRRFWHNLMRNAFQVKDRMGTVMVTALGMFGKSSAWPISTGLNPLVICLGSVKKKPWVVGTQIVPQDILNLAVMFDHDVVDGAPAARFLSRLSRLIEGAYGLKDS